MRIPNLSNGELGTPRFPVHASGGRPKTISLQVHDRVHNMASPLLGVTSDEAGMQLQTTASPTTDRVSVKTAHMAQTVILVAK